MYCVFDPPWMFLTFLWVGDGCGCTIPRKPGQQDVRCRLSLRFLAWLLACNKKIRKCNEGALLLVLYFPWALLVADHTAS